MTTKIIIFPKKNVDHDRKILKNVEIFENLVPAADRQPLSPREVTRREGSSLSAGVVRANFEAWKTAGTNT